MVGRELLTVCPNGEDHQGHNGGDKPGDGRIRGWKVTHGSRRLIVRTSTFCGITGTFTQNN